MCISTFCITTDYTNTTFRKQTAFVFASENKSSLHSKRHVCAISDDGESPNTHRDILHVTVLSKNYTVQ
jgi:hypothetical protein